MPSNGHGARRRDTITNPQEIPSFGYYIRSDHKNQDTDPISNFPAVPSNRLKNGFDYVDSVAENFKKSQSKNKPVKPAKPIRGDIGGKVLLAILWIGLIASVVYVVYSHFNQ